MPPSRKRGGGMSPARERDQAKGSRRRGRDGAWSPSSACQPERSAGQPRRPGASAQGEATPARPRSLFGTPRSGRVGQMTIGNNRTVVTEKPPRPRNRQALVP
jgi:hypothetical protein